MSLQDDIRTKLLTSSALVAAFTGGIVTYETLGAGGLNRTNYPTGFNGVKLKPIIIIKERDLTPTMFIKDEGAQLTSATQSVEIGFLDDRSTTFDTLQTGQILVRALLHDRNAGSWRLMLRFEPSNNRDYALQSASALVDVYEAHGILRVS